MNTSRTPRSSRSARAARTATSTQRPMGETGSQKPQPSSAKAAAQGGAATAAADGTGPGAHEADGVRVLKKYPNRRLYDTASSSYITLAEVKGLVMRAEPFVVRDAKTGEDLTRSILLQIILEEEAGGSPLLSEAMLCQLIRFYGHAMQGFFGAHLAAQIQAFAEMQQKMMAAAPAMGVENWPKAFDNWPKAFNNWPSNWQELMSRYAPFASSVAPMPFMSSTPSGQAWQQAQEQMQEQMQRQFQAGLQSWMAAFQPQAATPSATQAAPEPPQPTAKSSPKQQR